MPINICQICGQRKECITNQEPNTAAQIAYCQECLGIKIAEELGASEMVVIDD